MRRCWIGVVAGTLALCAPAGAADQSVTATPGDDFVPSTVTINVGERVTWTNGGGRHNVKFDDGSFEQPADPSTALWTTSRSFGSAGTFRYYCEEHGGPGGAGMSGTVVVQGASSPGTAPPPPSGPAPGPAPAVRGPMSVTFAVSDRTPARGQLVRFFGRVRPQHDGRVVQIQRRSRSGSYRTVARTRLRDAGATSSVYSRRLRIYRDGVYRVRIPGDADHTTGISRTRRLDVH